MDINEVIAIVRRYATAIAEGRIEAKKIKNMPDEELALFDNQLWNALKDAQEKAEKLAEGKTDETAN